MIGPQPDTKVRMRRNRVTGFTYLLHPCAVCGDPSAPFGYGVDLLRGVLGVWYCGRHEPERDDEQHEAT